MIDFFKVIKYSKNRGVKKMSLRKRVENAIWKAGLQDMMFVSESKSTNSIYINLNFCDTEIRISDHTKKFLGNVYDLDIAGEIMWAAQKIKKEMEKEGFEEEKINILKIEFTKIANSIDAKRENLAKAREVALKKRQERSLLAIEQAKEIINSDSEELDFLRRKNGLLIVGRELSFYRFLQKKGVKIKKRDAYDIYRETIWSQEQKG